MSIFTKRINYKPFEYPEVLIYSEAINKSFWVHSEVDFTADVQDFHSQLSGPEQNTVKNCLLAIAQIEVSVKSFWGSLYQHLPKPEFNGLGSTFAESEFRHSEAYSRLLEVLGYNAEFEKLIEIPVVKKRLNYLELVLKNIKTQDPRQYTTALILFSILIENVSLFSQFAIILSFTRFKGLMKNVSNIIAWTSVDEQIHANAGIYIVNKIKQEHPEFLDETTVQHILNLVKESMKVEEEMVAWIFEQGTIEYINQWDLINFMKYRADQSLVQIGLPMVFHINNEQYAPMKWFEEEIHAGSLDDFFAKRPVDYTKHDKSISALDLF